MRSALGLSAALMLSTPTRETTLSVKQVCQRCACAFACLLCQGIRRNHLHWRSPCAKRLTPNFQAVLYERAAGDVQAQRARFAAGLQGVGAVEEAGDVKVSEHLRGCCPHPPDACGGLAQELKLQIASLQGAPRVVPPPLRPHAANE
jgi:hypothetical protein